MPSYNSSYTGIQIDESVSKYFEAKTGGGIVNANTLTTTLSNYLLSTTAASTYLTKTDATNTYAPLTGTGTSGTWPISITGNAITVSRARFGDSSNEAHDANSIVTNGMYYYTSNGPASGAATGATTTDGALYTQAYSTNWVGQIAQDYRNGNLYTRGKNNGSWTAWNKILTMPTSVTSNVDLNSYTTTGIYVVGATTNYATSSGNHGILFVFWNVGTPFQVFWGDSSIAKARKRYWNGSSWSAWYDF